MPLTNLGWDLFTPEGIEFYGKVNFLKAGLISADVLTTVSSTYAKEILSKEFGFGLEGVLKKREKDLYGVINGIDYDEWDPSRDDFYPRNYSRKDISGKVFCKKKLVKHCLDHQMMQCRTHASYRYGRQAVGTERAGPCFAVHPGTLSFGVKLVILGKGMKNSIGAFQRLRKNIRV